MKTKPIIKLLTTLALGLLATAVQAAKIFPDDCPSMTLQQCVDSDNGGTGAFFITVKPGTYTNQDVTAFGRWGAIVAEGGSLTRPVFTDSIWLWDAVGTNASTVRGIKFTGQSGVSLWLTGTVNAGEIGRITVEDNEFDLNVNGGFPSNMGIQIKEIGLGGDGTFQVRINGNTVKAQSTAAPSSNVGLIKVFGISSSVAVDMAIYENRLQTNREDVPGLLINHDTANLDMIVSQNEFRGARAIRFIDNPTSGDLNFYAFYNLFADRYADGTRPVAENKLVISELDGTASKININFLWNTFDGRWDLLNFGSHAVSAPTNDLSLNNNIFTAANTTNITILVNGSGTATVSGDYNVIGEGLGVFGGYTPGGNDQIDIDPMYVAAPARYALRAGSPAIDTTGNADLILGLTQLAWFGNPIPDFLAAPHVDLDGFRRVIDGDGDGSVSADAGAYEWGDRFITHEASANNTSNSGHISYIHDTRLLNDADAVGIFTHLYRHEDTPGDYHDQPVGWWKNGWWALYNEDTAVAMNPGTVFSVFHPTGDRNVDTNDFRGLITVQNGGSASTSVDTGLSERTLAVFVRHVYLGGGAVYDNHPLEVFYDTGTNSWHIYHADGTDIPANAVYTVYYQQPSQNVFMATPGFGRVATLFGGAGVVFPHPLIDAAPTCVTPVIQQVALAGFFGTGLGDMPRNTGFDYFSGLGSIYAEDGTSPFVNYSVLGGGTGYFVMIDPQQAFECQDRIYKDDMDH